VITLNNLKDQHIPT